MPEDWGVVAEAPAYETQLSPVDETRFKGWKQQYAPKDSGVDYDLRGAFKAGLEPDSKTGHWPDTFKKPNHPTFSDQSQYAKDAPEKAGHWQGETYIPPSQAWSVVDTKPADPLHANITKAADLPSQEHFDASHQGALERFRSMLQPGWEKAKELADTPIAPMLQHLLEPPGGAYQPEPTTTPGKVARAVGGGVTQLAEGLTTPTNLGLMAATGALSGIKPLLGRAASAGFGLSMLKSMYDQSPEVRDAVSKRDWPRAAGAITRFVGTGAFAGLAGAHALKGEVAPVGETKPDIPETKPAITETKPGVIERATESTRAGLEAAGTHPDDWKVLSESPAPKAGEWDVIENKAAPAVGPSNEVVAPDLAGTVAQVPTDQIKRDPARFQYKANVGQGGAGEELREVQKFDPEKSGILSVWHDPADNETYVVNGHNRHVMAERLDEPSVTVRYLDAKDAQEARTKGALINIAEGRGDALDAAKVFRDSGMDAAAIEREGVSLKGEKARQGLALSKLDPHLFSKVVSGEIPVERASILGEGLDNPNDQRALYDLMQEREKGGKRLTNGQLGEMIKFANAEAPKVTETQESLFGSEEATRSLIAEKGDVSDYVRSRLAQEKRLFEAVSKESAASRLGTAGNVMKTGENAQIAEKTAQAQALYDKLSTSTGGVTEALNFAAEAIAKGEKPNAVKERAYENIKRSLIDQAKALTGTRETPSERPEGDAPGGADKAGAGQHHQVAERGIPRLPQALAGAKPRYAFGDKQFELKFASDLDKAAYITAQAARSKQDAGYLDFVREHTGLSAAQVRVAGVHIRGTIKSIAGRAAEGGVIEVPNRLGADVPEEHAGQHDIFGLGQTGAAESPYPATKEDALARLDELERERRAKGITPEPYAGKSNRAREAKQERFLESEERARERRPGERGGINPELISLGAGEFVKRDLKPAVIKVGGALAEMHDQALRLVAPDLRSHAAELTGLTLRVRMAQFARRYDQAKKRMSDAWKLFEKRTPDQNYQFMDDVEKGLGREQPSDELSRQLAGPGPSSTEFEPIARMLSRALDQRRREVQALGEGALDRFYTNYFPHIFERPELVPKFMESWLSSKAKLEGYKAFLQRRSYPTMAEAREAGLKPISDNPIDLVLAKLREMDRYIMAHSTVRDLADRGIAVRIADSADDIKNNIVPEGLKKAWLVPTKADVPEWFTSIHDPIGNGKWFADPGAAQVLNNYLEPGLRSKSGTYRIAIGINNSMNQANLGLSAFHLTGEAIRSVMNRQALGLKDIFSGHPVRGSVRFVTSPAGPFVDFLEGSKGVREWFKPGSEGAPIAAMIDGLMKGGARVATEGDYINGSAAALMREARAGNFPGAAIRILPAFFEQTSKPLMQQLIPRIKLGAAMQMAEQELGRLPQDADVDQVRRVMAKVWDSADNRMGQMVYDNLFWNRTFKDVTHLMVRAVGWGLGTVREFGGGAADVYGLARGRAPVTYDRISYVASAAMTTAMAGALYQYLHTGKGPSEVKDYFFPKREDGSRISMPTDIKDIYHYATAPVRTLENKTGPLINTAVELLHNRDFYNRPIREVDDPYYKQGLQMLDFIGRQNLPFTLQPRAGKYKFIDTNPEHKVENYLGFTRASGDIQDTQPKKHQKSPY